MSRRGTSPTQGRLPKATVTPLGTDQGLAALSEALPVLMLQKCAGLTLGITSQSATAPPQCPAFPGEAEHPLPLSLQAAARPLLPGSPFPRAPDDNLLYVLPASLPCPPAFPLCTLSFLRHCIFSYNIMSDPDFPKSTLSRLATSPVSLPAGPDQGPSSAQRGGRSNPSPTPHSGNHNTHFHLKSHPLYLGHKSFLKADKISSTTVSEISRMPSTLEKYFCPTLAL